MKSTSKSYRFLKRYKIPTASTIFSIFVIILAAIVFVLSLFRINTDESLTNSQDKERNHIMAWKVANEIGIVVGSTFSVNLLLCICIERENKNKAFEEFFLHDVISSDKFYNNLEEEEKKKMMKSLEANVYFNNEKIKKTIISHMRDRLDSTKVPYYYKKCHFDINCYIEEHCIRKEIMKTVEVVPVDRSAQNIKLILVKSFVQSGFNINEITINGKTLNAKREYSIKDMNSENSLDRRSGNTKYSIFTLKQKLKNYQANEDESYTVTVKYTSKVPTTDLVYICRTLVPCKSFSLQYEIKGDSDYSVNAYAFGFLDDAKKTQNLNDKSKIRIEFENWIFNGDGVAVVMS